MRSNIAKLIFGNGLGQLIQFGSILLFSRLYAPGDFGLLGQVQSYATAGAILCTLQLHLSLPLSKGTQEARELVAMIVSVCYAFALFALPITLWFGHVYVFALALGLCVGLSNTFNSYLVFQGNFGNISRFYVVRSIAIVTIQAGLGLAGIDDGLVWGAVCGEGATALYLAWRSRHVALPFMGIGWGRVLEMVRERRDFALFGSMQELVSVMAFYAPLLFFAHYFGDDEAGQYAMASRLVWAPVILFTSSLAQLIYHEYGQKQGGSASLRMLALPHSAYYLVLLAGPLVCLAARDLIVLALGRQWQLCADMLPLVVAWGSVFMAATPARALCRMLRQQKPQLVIDAGMLLGIAAVFAMSDGTPIDIMLGVFAIAAFENVLMIAVAWLVIRASQQGGMHDVAV